MSDVTLSFAVLLPLATIIASISGAWAVVRFKGDRNDAELALAKAEIAILRSDLNEFKIEAARRFVTTETLEKLEGRVIAAIDRLADRLDRLVEARTPRPRQS